MLSVMRVNSGQASSYYTKDDYYLDESPGQWHGELGEKLGFTGDIKEEDFLSLIKGVDPKDRFVIQSKVTKDSEKHTAGVDLTFSAPKSVSVAALVMKDERVIEAHNKAVNKTLDIIEKKYTNFRLHSGDEVTSEHSGNMLAAKFFHISSRELDPQLHTHCLVLNFTETPDGNMRAMDYYEVYKFKMFLGQTYRSFLAMEVKDLGYQVESDSKGFFEIVGMPKEMLEEFSQRSTQIEKRFEELRKEIPYLSDSQLKAQATIETRKVKDEPSIDVLRTEWMNRVDDYGIDLKLLAAQILTNEESQEAPDIKGIINKSLDIVTENEAAPRGEMILWVAQKLSVGHYDVDDLQKALDENQNVVKLNAKQYTTHEIIKMESDIVGQIVNGRGKYEAHISKDDVAVQTRTYELQKTIATKVEHNLTSGQKEAIQHILTSNDRVIAIQGDAGTGKTTMLDVIRTIYDQDNREMIGLSVTGKAASEIEEASQIKSTTLASFRSSDQDLKNKIVVVDEASMLSIREMKSILDRCDDTTKVVLIGDTKQLQSIGQGRIFSTLQEKRAIQSVRMSETIRQSGSPEYKDIVDTLGNREVLIAYDKLEQKGLINETKDRHMRLKTVANQYLENPRNTIIVTAANKDREELNQLIRAELVARGNIKHDVENYFTRESKSLMGADRYYAENYSVGDLIISSKDNVMDRAGSEGKIVSVNHKNNTIEVASFKDNARHTISLKEHGGDVQAYAEKNRAFATGDKILFLKNDKKIGVKNGQAGYITAIDKENGKMSIKLENGTIKTFDPHREYRYIGYGYTLTDYKAQGQTERHVIYHADTTKGVNFNQAYVGITRGKQSVTIYTDDKDKFKNLIQVEQRKSSTLDYNLARATSADSPKLQEIADKYRNIYEKIVSFESDKSGSTSRIETKETPPATPASNPATDNSGKTKDRELER